MDKKLVVGGVAVVLVLWSAGAASAEAPGGQQPFANCAEAQRAGQTNIPKGNPYYAAGLDRDGDGFACDDEDRGAATPAADDTSLGGAGTAGRGEDHAGEEGWHQHEDGGWGRDGDDDRRPQAAAGSDDGGHDGKGDDAADDAADRDDADADHEGEHADEHEGWDDEQVDVVPEGGAPTGDGSAAGADTGWWVGGGLLALLAGAGVAFRRRLAGPAGPGGR